ncbi:MAG: deoxyribodipyrimidine photo-lyase [Candidatus Peribacteria bacterium]|nr:MAG: deoxyribodipyrimidine photo-lyase [Candidatus Peribacteria bacterium]
MPSPRSLFIFRQDLRVFDNTGLYTAAEQSKEIIPVFIFDTQILQHLPAQDARLGFLIEAILALATDIRKTGGQLQILHGDPLVLIPQLLQQRHIDAIWVNSAYDSYGQHRDEKIRQHCQAQGKDFHQVEDFLLVDPDQVAARKVFTPFYKLWQTVPKRGRLLPLPKFPTTDYEKLDKQSLPLLSHDSNKIHSIL